MSFSKLRREAGKGPLVKSTKAVRRQEVQHRTHREDFLKIIRLLITKAQQRTRENLRVPLKFHYREFSAYGSFFQKKKPLILTSQFIPI